VDVPAACIRDIRTTAVEDSKDVAQQDAAAVDAIHDAISNLDNQLVRSGTADRWVPVAKVLAEIKKRSGKQLKQTSLFNTALNKLKYDNVVDIRMSNHNKITHVQMVMALACMSDPSSPVWEDV
jgi:hypothetical protein